MIVFLFSEIIKVKLEFKPHVWKKMFYYGLPLLVAGLAGISNETLEIYSPLAHRLGMAAVKSQLDDLAFKILHKEDYSSIESKLKTSNRQRKKLINSFISPIEIGLGKYKIKPEVLNPKVNILAGIVAMLCGVKAEILDIGSCCRGCIFKEEFSVGIVEGTRFYDSYRSVFAQSMVYKSACRRFN